MIKIMSKKKTEIEKIAEKYYKKHICFQCDNYITCKEAKAIGQCRAAFMGKLAIVGFVDYISHINTKLTEQITATLNNK
jgi:hypothetical protein